MAKNEVCYNVEQQNEFAKQIHNRLDRAKRVQKKKKKQTIHSRCIFSLFSHLTQLYSKMQKNQLFFLIIWSTYLCR